MGREQGPRSKSESDENHTAFLNEQGNDILRALDSISKRAGQCTFVFFLPETISPKEVPESDVIVVKRSRRRGRVRLMIFQISGIPRYQDVDADEAEKLFTAVNEAVSTHKLLKSGRTPSVDHELAVSMGVGFALSMAKLPTFEVTEQVTMSRRPDATWHYYGNSLDFIHSVSEVTQQALAGKIDYALHLGVLSQAS